MRKAQRPRYKLDAPMVDDFWQPLLHGMQNWIVVDRLFSVTRFATEEWVRFAKQMGWVE